MAEDPYLPFYYSDWLGSTRITLMSAAQERGLLRIICHLWANRDCALPDDDAVLARLSLLEATWTTDCPKIRECLIPHPERPGYVTSEKLLKIRRQRDEWRAKSAKGGQESGRSRRSKTGRQTDSNEPNANQTRTTDPTNHEPNNQPNANHSANQTPTNCEVPTSTSTPTSSSESVSKSTSTSDVRMNSEEEQTRARVLATRIHEKLGRPKLKGGDASLINKVAVLLASGRISENTVWIAVEGVQLKRPSNVMGYFHGTLKTMLAENDADFHSLLKATSVPEVLSRPMRRDPTSNPIIGDLAHMLSDQSRGVQAGDGRASEE